MCNCNCEVELCLQTVTASSSNVVLTTTNSTNLSSLQCITFKTGCKSVSDTVTGAPVPVQITINGTAVALNNKYNLPIFSNRVPRRSKGAYVVPSTGSPYVILFNTPCCKCNAVNLTAASASAAT